MFMMKSSFSSEFLWVSMVVRFYLNPKKDYTSFVIEFILYFIFAFYKKY